MSPRRSVTLQDVADAAGVSRSAASFALTNRGRLSDATRERVQEAARSLGYRPNAAAQSLRSARTGVVAVHVPEDTLTLGYYMEATFGIVDEASTAGTLVTFVPRGADDDPLSRLRADGIIVLDPTLDDPVLQRLIETGIPIVTGEPMPEGLPPGQGEVRSDHAATTRTLLDHFEARGARAPAIISLDLHESWSEDIKRAYVDWCAAHGLRERIEVVPLAGVEERTTEATRALLDPSDPADAIIALTDGSVLSVVTSAVEFGRVVGDDLLVAAAVDSPVLGYTDPAITAVDLHAREFGRECMRVMRQVLDSGTRVPSAARASSGPRFRRLVPTEVVFRASTAGRR